MIEEREPLPHEVMQAKAAIRFKKAIDKLSGKVTEEWNKVSTRGSGK